MWCFMIQCDALWSYGDVMGCHMTPCVSVLRPAMSCDKVVGPIPSSDYAIANKIIIGLFVVCVGCAVWCVMGHKFYLPKSCMAYDILLHCFNISGCLISALQAMCHAMYINHKGRFSFFSSVFTPSTLPVMIDAPSLPILITQGP